MDQRAEYLIQILENIGSPLMASITETSKDGDAEADAQKIAELLAKTVQVSIDMGNMTDLAQAGVQDDSLRVALAALAGPLVAGQYKQSGQVPGDNDLKRIITALQAVLTFSENFTPDPANTERLKNLEAQGPGGDVHQINIQYIEAFIPVVNAIGTFPFGQQEQKLIMDVSGKITERAFALRKSVLGDLPDKENQKSIDMAVLRALSHIYATCHEQETKRLMGMSEDERAGQPQAPGGGLSLDPVWSSFDTRTAMLEALAKSLLPGSEGETKAPETTAPPPPAAPPEQPAAESSPPPAPPPTETSSPPSDGANPMAMFANPKSEGASEPPPPAEPPKQTEPPNEAPPEKPPSEPSPAESENKEEPPASPSEPKDESGDGGENPMSFFKQPPKKDDES